MIRGSRGAFSYGRGYLLRLIFNLDTGDDDNGNAAGTAVISEEQLSELTDMINETGTDLNKFLELAKADTLAQVQAKKYDTAMAWLKGKRNDNS
jgi:hypothetical protein